MRETPRQARFAMFPNYRAGGRWLYAVGFDNGTVKFGIARNPRNRMQTYLRTSTSAIGWLHVFGRAPNDVDRDRGYRHPAESLAIKNACAIGERIGRSEYVRGLSKEQALQCMRLAIAEVRETVEA